MRLDNPIAAPGTPTLIGPFVVDDTDIPTPGSTVVLFTPQPGDVLLFLGGDRGTVAWDHGLLGVTTANGVDFGLNAVPAGFLTMQGVGYVFPSSDPVVLRSDGDDGTPVTSGHLEIYALVARAVSP